MDSVEGLASKDVLMPSSLPNLGEAAGANMVVTETGRSE